MLNYYDITDTERFDQNSYPHVIHELESISKDSLRMSGTNKSDIAISFLKDHCIKMDWTATNPKFVKFITSRSLATSHIESLFNSCRENQPFLQQFENYIKKQLH